MKILVFDFNEDFYPLYIRKLSVIENMDISFAKTIEDVLKNIKINTPDCILLNHLYNDKLKYYNTIRALGYKGDIIITIAGKENTIKRGFYNGISGIIDKSLNGIDFRAQFCNIMNKVG